MKVIGAGLGRTGTDSVKAALELLGFGPCHHMKEMFANPSSIRSWLRAAEEGRPDFVRLLGGFGSTVDWPSVFFWRQLVEAYPMAKVLLTVRDPQSWYNSVAETLYRSRYETIDAVSPAIREQFLARPALRDQPRLVERTIWQGTFRGRFADRAYASTCTGPMWRQCVTGSPLAGSWSSTSPTAGGRSARFSGWASPTSPFLDSTPQPPTDSGWRSRAHRPTGAADPCPSSVDVTHEAIPSGAMRPDGH